MKNFTIIFAGLNLIAFSAILQPADSIIANRESHAYALPVEALRSKREEANKPAATFIELILGIFDTLQLGRRVGVSKTHASTVLIQ